MSYFIEKLDTILGNTVIDNLFNRANKSIDINEITDIEIVKSYRNMVERTLNKFIETGVFSTEDIPELATMLYQYYLALTYTANHNEKFQYDNETIDNIVNDFLSLAVKINDYWLRRACQD